MAQLLNAFNANDFDPSQGAGALPVGKHPVIITESEVKATNSNDGGLLELTLKIIDGPQSGQTGAYRLNLYNKSEKAVEIAHRQLSALCHVIGVYNVTNTEALHQKPFIIEVGMQKGEEAAQKGYTEIKKVFDINGNEPGKAGAGQQQAQPAAQGFGGQPQGNGGGFGQQQQPQGQGFGAQQGQQPQGQAGWGGGQPAQQNQPAQQQQPQGGFGQQQPQGQPAGGAAWGGGGQPAQQAPQQNAAPAGGGGWQQQQQPQGGQPAWGK